MKLQKGKTILQNVDFNDKIHVIYEYTPIN